MPGTCANCLHGVAFLSWNQHPEPTGSRRATRLLIFQHQPGHSQNKSHGLTVRFGGECNSQGVAGDDAPLIVPPFLTPLSSIAVAFRLRLGAVARLRLATIGGKPIVPGPVHEQGGIPDTKPLACSQ
jgi:hypothetical protein